MTNNYYLIKKDNKLDILFDTYMYQCVCVCLRADIYNYSSFNYIYKIYINYVFYMLESVQNIEENKEKLLELKFRFNTKKDTLEFVELVGRKIF